MLPTFVIGLREGLEAALIVGIIAAFLRRQGRRDLLRWVLLGVGIAVALCFAAGVALDAVSRSLPQRQQEGLETVIGALAVAMVTYMVVWMRRHSRELKGTLEHLAAGALGNTSGRAGTAMVLMAFLAVLREGVETVVFLLAAFNESASGASAPAGAILGIVLAVGLGYAIYRGGLRINLSKFFRATGIVLVLVAGGLVVNALHTAHEAGWLNSGQSATFDLAWLARPGSVQSSLLTGMLGVQPRPVLIEVLGWLAYVVPVGLYVGRPPGRGPARATLARMALGLAVAAAVASAALALVAPGRPSGDSVTSAAPVTAQLVSRSGTEAAVRTQAQSPGGSGVGEVRDIPVVRTSSERRGGVDLDVYTADLDGNAAGTLPVRLGYDAIAAANGGRLPIGLRRAGATARMGYDDRNQLTVEIARNTGRIVAVRWHETVTGSVLPEGGGAVALSAPVLDRSSGLPAEVSAAALRAAASDIRRGDRHDLFIALALGLGVAAGLLAALGAVARLVGRRRPPVTSTPAEGHPRALMDS